MVIGLTKIKNKKYYFPIGTELKNKLNKLTKENP